MKNIYMIFIHHEPLFFGIKRNNLKNYAIELKVSTDEDYKVYQRTLKDYNKDIWVLQYFGNSAFIYEDIESFNRDIRRSVPTHLLMKNMNIIKRTDLDMIVNRSPFLKDKRNFYKMILSGLNEHIVIALDFNPNLFKMDSELREMMKREGSVLVWGRDIIDKGFSRQDPRICLYWFKNEKTANRIIKRIEVIQMMNV